LNLLFPNSIAAGLSFKREVVSDLYPAPDWELRAILRGPASIDLVAVASGTAHAFATPASGTGVWQAGQYAYSIRAHSGDDVHELEAGQLVIAADLVAVQPGHDARGHAQRTLDAIEAVIEGRASRDQQSYTISGRTLVRTPIADLIMLRTAYRKEVKQLKAGGRGKRILGRRVVVGYQG
jgi:hypothetical protein